MHDRHPLLTTGELARVLGLSRVTVMRYRRAGRIRPTIVTANGHARWDYDDVVTQLREAADEPTTE